MARKGGKDRGLFERDGAWWVRRTCPYGHEHRECIGPKGLAKAEYQKRKVAVKTSGYCLDRAREDKPTLFRDAATRDLIWAQGHRPRSVTFREKSLKHLLASFGSKTIWEITRAAVESYQTRRRDAGAAPGTVNRKRAVLSHRSAKRFPGGWRRRIRWLAASARENPMRSPGP